MSKKLMEKAFTVQELDEQVELAGNDNPLVRQALLFNEYVHSEILSVFKATGTSDERTIVDLVLASDRDDFYYPRNFIFYGETSPVIFKVLAYHPDEYVRADIAQNDYTPIEVLEQLAGDPDHYVRFVVAKSERSSPALLTQLASTNNQDVRECVVKNKNTPAIALERLAKSRDSYIRFYVAQHLNTSLEVLIRLADDEDPDVRNRVAENPNYVKP